MAAGTVANAGRISPTAVAASDGTTAGAGALGGVAAGAGNGIGSRRATLGVGGEASFLAVVHAEDVQLAGTIRQIRCTVPITRRRTASRSSRLSASCLSAARPACTRAR